MAPVPKMQCSLAFLVALLVSSSISKKESRIINGNVVDSLRRFSHYVTILTTNSTEGLGNFCAGSIVSDKWIMTSLNCVRNADKLDIVFREAGLHTGTYNSFSITVTNSAVTGYPTGYDNIALIRLPILLKFDSDMKPIKLGTRLDKGDDFAVMPGFDSYLKGETLVYGMFEVTSKNTCKKYYGSKFDDFLQICTKGWRNNNQAPCGWNEGAGLISGWPREPRLIGIFSKIAQCKEGSPAIFTDVSKYRDWMISVTGQDLLIDWTI